MAEKAPQVDFPQIKPAMPGEEIRAPILHFRLRDREAMRAGRDFIAGLDDAAVGHDVAQFSFAFQFPNADSCDMSSREMVIDLVNKLPENASLAEIAREIELLAGIEKARQQARRNEGIPAADARKLVDAWASK